MLQLLELQIWCKGLIGLGLEFSQLKKQSFFFPMQLLALISALLQFHSYAAEF